MMEEIDRFQVPPVNGETQPLVRDEKENMSSANNSKYKFIYLFICFDYKGYYDQWITIRIASHIKAAARTGIWGTMWNGSIEMKG